MAWDLNTCAAALGRCRTGTNVQFRFGGWRRPRPARRWHLALRAARASRRTCSLLTKTSVAKARVCGCGAPAGPVPAPGRDPAAQNPDRPVVDTAVDVPVPHHHVTSHPAIARSKISPPSDVTTSAMFVAKTCSSVALDAVGICGCRARDSGTRSGAGLFSWLSGLAGAATSCPIGWLDDFD